jgi:hypothetical protein
LFGIGVCGGKWPSGQRYAKSLSGRTVAGRPSIKHNAGDYTHCAANALALHKAQWAA